MYYVLVKIENIKDIDEAVEYYGFNKKLIENEEFMKEVINCYRTTCNTIDYLPENGGIVLEYCEIKLLWYNASKKNNPIIYSSEAYIDTSNKTKKAYLNMIRLNDEILSID